MRAPFSLIMYNVDGGKVVFRAEMSEVMQINVDEGTRDTPVLVNLPSDLDQLRNFF